MLGIWSGNACFGNIVGTALVAAMFYCFDRAVAWKIALVLSAGLVALYGMIVHFFLVADPKHALYHHTSLEDAKPDKAAVKMSPKNESSTESEDSESLHESEMAKVDEPTSPRSEGISFVAAWCIPGVRVSPSSYVWCDYLLGTNCT